MRTGADCLIQVADLNEGAERALLQGYAPDLVFSINCLRPAQTIPAFRHVLWIQDNIFNGRDLRYTRLESEADDLVYVMAHRLKNSFCPPSPLGLTRRGTCSSSVILSGMLCSAIWRSEASAP